VDKKAAADSHDALRHTFTWAVRAALLSKMPAERVAVAPSAFPAERWRVPWATSWGPQQDFGCMPQKTSTLIAIWLRLLGFLGSSSGFCPATVISKNGAADAT